MFCCQYQSWYWLQCQSWYWLQCQLGLAMHLQKKLSIVLVVSDGLNVLNITIYVVSNQWHIQDLM